MKFVAFLRNVNLGQPGSPTRPQLEAAFLEAGAGEAASFMSNGTVLFSVSRSRVALSTARRACGILSRVCGLKEPVFVQPFERLAKLAVEEPFAAFSGTPVAERCITFFDSSAGEAVKLRLESPRHDCVVFRLEDGLALSVTYDVNGKIGYPTPVLEKALKVPVTTRGWRTILRLVKRHGRLRST